MRRCLRHTVLLLAATVTLSACQPNRFFSAWLPWWAGSTAIAPLGTNAASLFSELSPSSFGTDTNTAVHLVGSCSRLQAATAAARTAGVPVIATVFDSTAAKVMAGIVTNPTTRGQHVQHLVDLVMHGGVGTCTGAAFDGVDLDYEQFAFADGRSTWAATQTGWVAFITQLADALHAKGKLLSVTVPPARAAVGTGGVKKTGAPAAMMVPLLPTPITWLP